MKKHVSGCLWAHERVLVSVRTSRTLPLPATLSARLVAVRVDCVINLLSRDQFRAAGADVLFAPLDDLSSGPAAGALRRVNMAYVFWPEEDTVPTARQVRQTLDEIDEAHAVGLTVFLHGADIPSRAVIAAGCWLARQEDEARTDDDPATTRLGWLYHGHGSTRRVACPVRLTEAQQALVLNWPAGRRAEPVLGVTELLDETEPYPTATVEYWLRTLPTARVYPQGRTGYFRTVPVTDEKRIEDGTIHLGLADLHAGTWVGERTLRLLDGTVVVFISAGRKRNL